MFSQRNMIKMVMEKYILSVREKSVKYLDEQEYLEWKKQIFWMPEMKIESCELGEILK